ncbi:MAG: carbohydrate binding domain-containing protein [Muribaculaceae bacterium]|nr:carbohydrate binding domain-containing protein [Muribaculaceae bacterium]
MTIRRVALSMLIAIAATAEAQTANDSIDVFTYSTDDGTSGLRLATRRSKGGWRPIDDLRLVSSDFGAWGSQKKMYKPSLRQGKESGIWHLTFDVLPDGTTAGYTSSPDLTKWTVQEYRHANKIDSLIGEELSPAEILSDTINGQSVSGNIIRMAKADINRLKAYNKYRKELEAKYSQSCDGDEWRFAGIDTVEMTISFLPDKAKPISDRLFGIFFEDINYAADGGLYAELIQNRDFEYSSSDRHNWHALKSWSLTDSTKGNLTISETTPLHINNPHYAHFDVIRKGAAIVNEGYDGIAVKKGGIYDFSAWVRAPKTGNYTIALKDSDGKTIGSCKINLAKAGEWTQLSNQIKANADCSNATLTITPGNTGTHDFDLISLMPADTYNGRKNGLRKDLASTLAALKPSFIRFPGGCVAHGDGVDNIYDWKGSIGPLESRTGKRNLWGYHQTRGLGYHEYFLMCEDFGASPLPVLAAGVPCQNSSRKSHHSVDGLTSHGQQCGIPMEEMPAYIQDILDLIEYANGDITTEWGAKRAEAGHPEPFNLKMIGIGNEDLITEAFKERFSMIFNAIKEKYPEIEVIGSVGPFYEGPDYETGWEFARENNIPIVDEHYYVSPGWLIHNGHFYDSYPRGKGATKVYLGEYASHRPGRESDMEAALSDALYLTNVERNADVVAMTSYAPLLAKKNHTQWSPDLIYFDNETITLTPDYYVQKMFGNNAGTLYKPAEIKLSDNNPDLFCRLGQSVVVDTQTGDTIIKLVNLTPATVNTSLPLSGIADYTILAGLPSDRNVSESTGTIDINEGAYIQPPYSFSVLRFKTR